jgi:hypothetical protein
MKPAMRWIYVLPALHLSICVVLLFGIYAVGWSLAGLLWGFLLLIDLPISLPYYVLGWKYGFIVLLWVVIAGTFWWYQSSRFIRFLSQLMRN